MAIDNPTYILLVNPDAELYDLQGNTGDTVELGRCLKIQLYDTDGNPYTPLT